MIAAVLVAPVLMSALGPPVFQRELTAEVVGVGTAASEDGDWPVLDLRLEDGRALRIPGRRGLIVPLGSEVIIAHYQHDWPWRRDSYRFVRIAVREPWER